MIAAGAAQAALVIAASVAGLSVQPAFAAGAPPRSGAPVRLTDTTWSSASAGTHRVAEWVVASGDNGGLPFVIVDKIDARVFAFDRRGGPLGSAPALLGLAPGDISPAGIGTRKLADITPAERITPAGRFVAALGPDLGAKDVLWVDYDAAISLHRVFTGTPSEHRLARLATPSVLDNRISYGCINVPVAFYETVVHPLFAGTRGVVYVLPDTRPLGDVFPGIASAPRSLAGR